MATFDDGEHHNFGRQTWEKYTTYCEDCGDPMQWGKER